MEITIRKATIDDYNAISELFDEIDSLHRDNLPHIFQKPGGIPREQNYYLGLIVDENNALFVAEVGGSLVGFVHAIIRDNHAFPIFVPRCNANVECIIVKSEFQHHGIGRTLMENMQTWAMDKGATSIELNVYEFNQTAISFYDRLGYKALSRKMRIETKKG